jgi:hypothetical protein
MTITMLIVPLIVNTLTPNNTNEEWAHAFWANAAIMVVCNIFYVCFGKGEIEPWARADHFRARMAKIQAVKQAKKEAIADVANNNHSEPIKHIQNGGNETTTNGYQQQNSPNPPGNSQQSPILPA